MPTKKTQSTKKVTSSNQATPEEESVYKANFDSAVRELEAIRTTVLQSNSLSDLAKADMATRSALLTLQKYAMDLGFWMREAVEKRRSELIKGE